MGELGDKLLKLTALRYQHIPALSERLRSNSGSLAEILQCHLFAEQLLEELIRLCLGSNADAVFAARLSFTQKLDIAARLQLTEGWSLVQDHVVGSLRKLNALRNDLAHNYGREVTEEDIRGLFVGCEEELPYQDILDAGINIGINRYAAFIFGNMLPKYEVEA